MNILQLLTLNPPTTGPRGVLPPAAELPREPAYTPMSDLDIQDRLERFVQADPHPLPLVEDRELYHGDRHFDYWLSGLADALRMIKTYERWAQRVGGAGNLQLLPGERVLDLGCASGRVIRHFAAQRPDLEAWGADINRAHIDWILTHLPKHVRAFQSTAYPHLPLEDASFAMISAFSVFTHIEELELAWLLEVRRCLRPGGIAYITAHTDYTWARLGPQIPVWQMIQGCAKDMPDLDLSESAFKTRPMPQPRIVFDHRTRALYNVNIFHHTDYITSVWGRYFDICEILRGASGYQDVIVMRKPLTAAV